MTEKILSIIEKGDYKIPFTLYKNYKKYNLNEKELIYLVYLLNEEKMFDPKKMADVLSITVPDVLEVIDALCSKGIIELKLKNGPIREEVICLDNLYKKLAYSITSEEVKQEATTIYDMFEQEFSRTLSPIEYELINGWLSAGFNEEIISFALKEAVYNGATNLRYIDKILYEWKKKGIDSKEAYEKDKEKFQNSKREIKPKKELLEYDWLNDSNG